DLLALQCQPSTSKAGANLESLSSKLSTGQNQHSHDKNHKNNSTLIEDPLALQCQPSTSKAGTIHESLSLDSSTDQSQLSTNENRCNVTHALFEQLNSLSREIANPINRFQTSNVLFQM